MSAASARGAVECGGHEAESQKTPMPQKVASFLKTQWFPVITVLVFVLNSIYGQMYADRDQAREIADLVAAQSDIRTNALPAIAVLRANDTLQVSEIDELKKSIFRTNSSLLRMEGKMNKLERNLDRVVWVVDELARKNGIVPPKQLDNGG